MRTGKKIDVALIIGLAIRLELEIGESFDYATNMTFLGWIEE